MQALMTLECVRNQVSYLVQYKASDVKDPVAKELMVKIYLLRMQFRN
jgi:hypothetical protein